MHPCPRFPRPTFALVVLAVLAAAVVAPAGGAETGAPLAVAPAPGEHTVKTYTITTPITVKKHEFRAIAVGSGE